MDWKELEKLLDKEAKTLVGILLKRVEVLDKEKALTPSLYKSLTKEIIYEQFRSLKKLLSVYFNIGKITFRSRENHSA